MPLFSFSSGRPDSLRSTAGPAAAAVEEEAGKDASVRLMEEYMRKAAQSAADKQREEEQAEQRRVRLGEDPRREAAPCFPSFMLTHFGPQREQLGCQTSSIHKERRGGTAASAGLLFGPPSRCAEHLQAKAECPRNC